MLISQIFKKLNYNIENINDTDITDVVYDSRKIKDGCIFVCLKGASLDGHKFAKQAVDSGASVIVCEDDVDVAAPTVKVEDTRAALAEISAAFFGHPAEELKVIGLTGTKGKTTTAWMIHSILTCAGHKTGIIGTIGVLIGDTLYKTNNTTPESYEIQMYLRKMVDEGCDSVVIEASSIGLKAHRTDGMLFDYGVFSNFSHDHIGGLEHKDMDEYLHCKQLLFQKCRVGIVNIDDPKCDEIIEGHTCSIETYGCTEKANYYAYNDHLLRKEGFLGVSFNMLHDGKEYTIDVGIPGRFSVYNALSAIAVCLHFGVTEEEINEGLSNVKVKGRVEMTPVHSNYTMLIDYAHNALSMENILTTLREYNPNRLICLFGAGGNRPKVRRYEMGEACGRLADLSVVTEDNSRDEDVMDIIADIIGEDGMGKTDGNYIVIPDRTDAIRYCIKNAQDGDIIVLAGKGHEDYQEKNGKKIHYDEREIIEMVLGEEYGINC